MIEELSQMIDACDINDKLHYDKSKLLSDSCGPMRIGRIRAALLLFSDRFLEGEGESAICVYRR